MTYVMSVRGLDIVEPQSRRRLSPVLSTTHLYLVSWRQSPTTALAYLKATCLTQRRKSVSSIVHLAERADSRTQPWQTQAPLLRRRHRRFGMAMLTHDHRRIADLVNPGPLSWAGR
jgi:hypothetical protein